MSHSDLDHGNILINDMDTIKLIDVSDDQSSGNLSERITDDIAGIVRLLQTTITSWRILVANV